MRTDTLVLTAGTPKVVQRAGSFLRVLAATADVTVTMRTAGASDVVFKDVQAGAAYKAPPGRAPFDEVVFESASGNTVKYVIGEGESSYDATSVSLSGATVSTLPGTAVVGVAAAQVLASSSGRKKIVFRSDDANTAAKKIYIGPVGITTATGAIALEPGDTWVEEVAAAAEWYAIAEVAAQNLRIMVSA